MLGAVGDEFKVATIRAGARGPLLGRRGLRGHLRRLRGLVGGVLRRRQRFGVPLARFQLVQELIADMIVSATRRGSWCGRRGC